MRLSLLTVAVLSAVGCGPTLELSIDDPVDGLTVYETESVELAATVLLDGEPSDASVSWSDGGSWSAEGQALAVTDLPVGSLILTATVSVDDLSASATVPVTIEAIPDPTPYGGTQDINITVSTSDFGPFDLKCDHKALSLELSFVGALTGSGTCDAYGEYTFAYDGQVTDGTVTGTMVLTSEDSGGETMDFTGTIDAAGIITVSYDETFSSSDGSLRVYGTTTSNPE